MLFVSFMFYSKNKITNSVFRTLNNHNRHYIKQTQYLVLINLEEHCVQ